jgi:dihydroorotase (multifunctional complex type)
VTFDLGIEGGTIVTPSGREPLNLYVEGEHIAAITAERQPARVVVDASSLYVMPGMVDTHVHLMDPAQTDREDFPKGTAAAARAGVTTVVEHTHAGPVRTPKDLREKCEYLANRSRVDFGLAAHAWPDRLDQIEPVWAAGATCLKAFTCTTHGVPGFDPAHLLELFQHISAVDAICLVHCEEETMTAEAERLLRASGRTDGGTVPAWRNLDAELTALLVTSFLARRTGAHVVAAHVSSPDGLAILERERAAGARLEAECCPQYLTLFEDEVLRHGALRKFTPPARARTEEEQATMWQALMAGRIQLISTDHAPSTLPQKQNATIWDAPFGLPGLDTTLPVLLDAAHRGLVSYEQVVRAYSEAPARIYRLHPRKGWLGRGADADIILVDPHKSWTVTDADIASGAGWSPFSGRTLVGRAVRTYLRGALAVDEGRVMVDPGHGRFIAGPGAR